jgi:hypothetical protein
MMSVSGDGHAFPFNGIVEPRIAVRQQHQWRLSFTTDACADASNVTLVRFNSSGNVSLDRLAQSSLKTRRLGALLGKWSNLGFRGARFTS